DPTHVTSLPTCRLSRSCDAVGRHRISTVGSSVTSAVVSNVKSFVVSHTFGRSAKPTDHWYHDEFAHSVIGLRHSGHCSAPMIRLPSPSTSSHEPQLLKAE